MFTLHIETENDAFYPDPCDETARLLAEIATRIKDGETDGKLRDANGNTVGRWEFSTLLTGRGNRA